MTPTGNDSKINSCKVLHQNGTLELLNKKYAFFFLYVNNCLIVWITYDLKNKQLNLKAWNGINDQNCEKFDVFPFCNLTFSLNYVTLLFPSPTIYLFIYSLFNVDDILIKYKLKILIAVQRTCVLINVNHTKYLYLKTFYKINK